MIFSGCHATRWGGRQRRRVQALVGFAPETIRALADLVTALAKVAREGRMEDLLCLLDPEVTPRPDPTAPPPGLSGRKR